MTALPRPRRSALYLPASNARAIEKARTLACDVVILDLEDAVAPDRKDDARALAVAAIRDGGFGTRELVVRVNGLDTDWAADDLAALRSARPDAILLPKVSDAAVHAMAAERLGAGHPPLWAMIETTRSIFALDAIAASGFAAFVLGTNDLAKEMGARLDGERLPFLGMMGLAVAAARAHGIAILDGVYNALEDAEGLARQCEQAVAFGFDGKTLIHPGQIATCNAAFTPDAAAVAAARAIVEAFASPENASAGAIRLEGRMVERLHLDQAQRVLAAAR